MTEAQRQWAATQQFCLRIRPEVLLRRPERKVSALCYDFIMPGSNPWFDMFIVATIIVNSASIATTSFGDSDEKIKILGTLNLVCSSIFVIEATLKGIALGKQYFQSKWNRFDFVIVCGVAAGEFCLFFCCLFFCWGHHSKCWQEVHSKYVVIPA